MRWCRAGIVVFGAVLTLLLHPDRAAARVWHIRPDGTGDAPTIQAGVDSALAGDEVVLASGTYSWTTQGTGVRLAPR